MIGRYSYFSDSGKVDSEEWISSNMNDSISLLFSEYYDMTISSWQKFILNKSSISRNFYKRNFWMALNLKKDTLS